MGSDPTVVTKDAPEPRGPYVHARQHGGLVYVTAQIEFVDEHDLDAMNRIYGERFHDPLPARTSFGVAFLWKGAKVQIDCIAALD